MDNNTQPSDTSNEPVQPTEPYQPTSSSLPEQPVESAPIDQPEQPAQPTASDIQAPSAELPQSVATVPSFGQSVDSTAISPTEPAPTTEPTPAAPITPGTAFGSGGGVVATKPKRSKKPLVIGILVALVVVIVGLVLAYFFWYQNPDKVVADGFVNLAEANQMTMTGSDVTTGSGMNAAIDFNGGISGKAGLINATLKLKTSSGLFKGIDLSVKGSAIMMSNDDVYFKVSNLQQTVSAFVDELMDSQADAMGLGSMTDAQRAQVKQEAMKEFQPIIDQLDNQWIKVSSSDLNDDSKTQKCLNDAFNMLETDKSATNELADVYKKNKFVVVEKKLGSKDGSLGYQLKFDKDAAKKFVKQAGDTKFGKALTKCDGLSSAVSTLSDGIDSLTDNISSSTTKVWIGRFNHQITDISFNGAAKSDTHQNTQFEFKPDFSRAPSITAPQNAKTYKDVEKSLDAFYSDTGTSLAL